MQLKDFEGAIVVVTGASTGLGRAIAVGAAQRGARAVVVNYARSAEEAEETAAAVRGAGAEAAVVQGDVAADADCAGIAEAASRFGRIDALFNNAGITKFAPRHGDLDALTGDDFLRLYDVNVVGAFRMTRAARSLLEAAERTAQQGPAAVVNTSSIAGVTGIGSSVAYAASKGALNTLTISLARALAPRIRVNAVCPGYIDTPWHARAGAEFDKRLREGAAANTPLKAASTAEDIADSTLFLGSPLSRHVTGETLLVDAGTHLGYAGLMAK